MKKLLLILLIPALAFTGKPEKKGSLKGKMKFTETVKMVYLSYISGDKRVTDSVILKKGKFEFQTKVAEPTLATLSVRFEPGATDVKPRTDRMQLFIEPGKIKVETSDSLKFAMPPRNGKAGPTIITFNAIELNQDEYYLLKSLNLSAVSTFLVYKGKSPLSIQAK